VAATVDVVSQTCQLRKHIRNLKESLAAKYEALTSSLVEHSRKMLGEGDLSVGYSHASPCPDFNIH
jgi:hypothetical protein